MKKNAMGALALCAVVVAGGGLFAQEGEEEPSFEIPVGNCEIVSCAKRKLAAEDFAILKTMLQHAGSPAKASWEGEAAWKLTPKRLDPAFASSFVPADKFGDYGPASAIDMEPSTAWAEGAKGSGVGEWLAWRQDYLGSLLSAKNGYATSAWKLNNRIKEARIRIFAIGTKDATSPLPGKEILVADQLLDVKVVFDDVDDWAYASLSEYLPSVGQYLFVLEILSVYKGTKYDDTCLAEISFTAAQ